MAKINDLTAYPNTGPAITDHIPGTDISNTTNDANGETVTFTLQSILNLFQPALDIAAGQLTSGTIATGFFEAFDNDGSKSSGTYTPSVTTGNNKVITNDGAFTLDTPSINAGNKSELTIFVINGAAAGSITFDPGYTLVNGDSLDTVDTNKFIIHIRSYNISGTEYHVAQITALQ